MEHVFNVDNKEIRLSFSIWTGKISLVIDGKKIYSSIKLGIASTIGDVIAFLLGIGITIILLKGI